LILKNQKKKNNKNLKQTKLFLYSKQNIHYNNLGNTPEIHEIEDEKRPCVQSIKLPIHKVEFLFTLYTFTASNKY
jgi:hypothetical protein